MPIWQRNTGDITFATGRGYSSSINDLLTGVQQEARDFIRRQTPWPGIIQGLTPSINGTSVDIASGIGTVLGAMTLGTRATPVSPAEYPYAIAMSYDFTGEANDDYWLYLDGGETAETDALKIYTDPASLDLYEDLLLGKVTWTSPTLSALVDLRWFGTGYSPLYYYHADALPSGDVCARWEIGEDCALRGEFLASLQDAGSGAGPTVLSVYTGTPGSTVEVYSTAGDRFSIAHDSTDEAQVVGIHPDQNLVLNAGDCVEVKTVGAPATGAAGLSVILPRFCYNVVA